MESGECEPWEGNVEVIASSDKYTIPGGVLPAWMVPNMIWGMYTCLTVLPGAWVFASSYEGVRHVIYERKWLWWIVVYYYVRTMHGQRRQRGGLRRWHWLRHCCRMGRSEGNENQLVRRRAAHQPSLAGASTQGAPVLLQSHVA